MATAYLRRMLLSLWHNRNAYPGIVPHHARAACEFASKQTVHGATHGNGTGGGALIVTGVPTLILDALAVNAITTKNVSPFTAINGSATALICVLVNDLAYNEPPMKPAPPEFPNPV